MRSKLGYLLIIVRAFAIKPSIARLPAIKLDLINRPSGEMDCFYEAIVK